MAKQNVYAIFDTASGLYGHPNFALADGEIMRTFSDLANDKTHPVGQHPEDYALYRLATYDNLNGELNNEANECLATALEVLSQKNNVIDIDDQKPGLTA